MQVDDKDTRTRRFRVRYYTLTLDVLIQIRRLASNQDYHSLLTGTIDDSDLRNFIDSLPDDEKEQIPKCWDQVRVVLSDIGHLHRQIEDLAAYQTRMLVAALGELIDGQNPASDNEDAPTAPVLKLRLEDETS